MKYAKLINGALEWAPKNQQYLGIEIIHSKESMLKKGYKPVIDIKPIYDKEKYRIESYSYQETDISILVNYNVISLNPELTDSEKISELQDKIGLLDEDNLSLLVSNFELDFRLFEVECIIEDAQPKASSYNKNKKSKGENTMRTVYEQAKRLILLGEYQRSDMEYKLSKYRDRSVISQAEYNELISLMDSMELLQ